MDGIHTHPRPTTTRSVPATLRFVILASDGLWDVVTNDEAVKLVLEFFERYRYRHQGKNLGSGSAGGEGQEGMLRSIARRLALEAFVRGSSDNISVVVVDLGGLTLSGEQN